ncbi:MAG: carbohydrate binding domain-containing protein [Clostridia bacterium]|nr:carbohydrate binding domain-containing protein [Clostridia bacterium]
MKTKILILALVLVMVGTCMPAVAVQPTGENLITNGSFEDGLTGWKLAKGASGEPALTVSSGTVTADEKTDGSSAVMITGTSDERAVLRQFLPAGTLEAGKQYQISACINITSGTKARIALREGDIYNGTAVCDLIGRTPFGTDTMLSTGITNGWVRLSKVFTCGESTATNGCSFIVDTNTNALELYIDDVQLRETDTGLLKDNGEFETFSPDFSFLTEEQHTTWLGRTNATMPGDLTLKRLERTEDYGTALCLTGKGSGVNSTILFNLDSAKLSALAADTPIKFSFRIKVVKETVGEEDKNANVSFGHRKKQSGNTGGRFSAWPCTIPKEYFNQWVTVEHWFPYRPVADQVYRLDLGINDASMQFLLDDFSAVAEETAAVAEGKTIFLYEELKTIGNGGDEYSATRPDTFLTTRASIDEAYTLDETANIYVRYPTMEGTEQKGTIVCAVYSTNEDGMKMLETVKTGDATAIVAGDCGTVVEFPLTGITVQDGKTYTLETMVWDGVSGLRPLAGAAKLVAPITEATAE